MLLLELGKIGEVLLLKYAGKAPGNTRAMRISSLETLASKPSIGLLPVVMALSDSDIKIQECAEYIILNVFKRNTIEQFIRGYSATVANELLSTLNAALSSPDRDCWERRVVQFLEYLERLLMSIKA